MSATGPARAFDDADLRGLLECLENVPDPRRRRGTRHRAAVVLAFAVAAVIAGADSLTAISEWASDVPPEVLDVLGAWRDRRGRRVPPSRSTFRRVLRRLDGQVLAAALGAWLKGQVAAGLADAVALVIALDGKTVRGARSGDDKAPHLLAAMICGARAVLAQKNVDAKTNEITQVRPLLRDVDIAGALVTADALHVQQETARYLVEDKHADYLFTAVKDNQPSVFAALDALDWENTPITHTMHDRGFGRDETRTIQVLPAPDDLFPHAAQAFLIERTVRDPHDGHLRSAVASLGITRLLDFDLIARFKQINTMKLHVPGRADQYVYPALAPALTRPVRWEIIENNYDLMMKYATAIRLHTASTEALLRRFTSETTHPAYAAMLEVGRAQRSIFLARWLRDRDLQRETESGLNVVENYNGVNDYIRFGKRGELASNRREEQELGMLCLHILQSSLGLINTS